MDFDIDILDIFKKKEENEKPDAPKETISEELPEKKEDASQKALSEDAPKPDPVSDNGDGYSDLPDDEYDEWVSSFQKNNAPEADTPDAEKEPDKREELLDEPEKEDWKDIADSFQDTLPEPAPVSSDATKDAPEPCTEEKEEPSSDIHEQKPETDDIPFALRIWHPLEDITFRTAEEEEQVEKRANQLLAIYLKRYPLEDSLKADVLDFLKTFFLFIGYGDSPYSCLNDVYSLNEFIAHFPKERDIDSYMTDFEEILILFQKHKSISPLDYLENSKKPSYYPYGDNGYYKNIFREFYGEYIKDFKPFQKEFDFPVKSMDEIHGVIQEKIHHGEEIDWSIGSGKPYYRLLVHPFILKNTSKFLNASEPTMVAIMMVISKIFDILVHDVKDMESPINGTYQILQEWDDGSTSNLLVVSDQADFYCVAIPSNHAPSQKKLERIHKNPAGYQLCIENGRWKYPSVNY